MSLIDVMASPRLLLARVVYASVSIIMIWSSVKMDYIMYTPVDFLPYLVLIGFAVSLWFTWKKGKLEYQETVKDKLRDGTWKTAPEYGMDYLAANITNVIVGAVATVIIPGLVYGLLDAEPTLPGCIVIGLVVALAVGVKGPKSVSEVVDMFRNNAKIKDLEALNKEDSEN